MRQILTTTLLVSIQKTSQIMKSMLVNISMGTDSVTRSPTNELDCRNSSSCGRPLGPRPTDVCCVFVHLAQQQI